MSRRVVVSAAVEGIVDGVVVEKVIQHAGGELGNVYGKTGKASLIQKIYGYNNAARRAPWIVLVDLDHDAECAPQIRPTWLEQPARHMCFRIAVREIEAWLMADSETLAGFLRISQSKIPDRPEEEDRPKEVMVNLARHSRRRAIREDMVPRETSGRIVGPAYASRLMEYVETYWRPEIAARKAESLQRAIQCLRRLTKRAC